MAKRLSQPNGYLSNVWDITGDTFDHNDIKGWLDEIDRLFGLLFSNRFPLGAVVQIDGPSLSASPDNNPIVIPVGWGLCDGRTVTAGNHDFPSPYAGQTIYLPDYRGRVLVGADSTKGVGVAGTVTANPGVKGRQGAATAIVPPHFHIHDHTHGFGGNDAIETTAASSANTVNTDASGSGYTLTRLAHTHALKRQSTSQAEDPNAPDTAITSEPGARTMTTQQILATGGTTIKPTGGSGGGDNLVVDTRDASAAVYHIMKIKLYAGSPTP